MTYNPAFAQKALAKQAKAVKVVETIIDDLCDRGGFDEAFDLPEDILDEIKCEMMKAILTGFG